MGRSGRRRQHGHLRSPSSPKRGKDVELRDSETPRVLERTHCSAIELPAHLEAESGCGGCHHVSFRNIVLGIVCLEGFLTLNSQGRNGAHAC